MKLDDIKEPLLEFGKGEHICPRAGIAYYDVYDTKLNARRDKILVGAVGTSDTLSKLHNWLDKCEKPIAPNISTQSNLNPEFCGFNKDYGYKAKFILEEEITRSFNNSDINKIVKIQDWNERINQAVELYYRQVKFLAQNRVIDVVICIIPNHLCNYILNTERKISEDNLENDKQNDLLETNFRRALKAKTMHLAKPLQLIREVSLEVNSKGQQSDATKAWNFCTAMYYKANKTVPWKLITNVNKPSVCFVGIGFYRSRDRTVLNTSLAQIFDELGNSVILRGTPVNFNKNDKRPYLTEEQAYILLKRALNEYDIALSNSPSRLVIHKSSNYNEAELEGFRKASDEMRVRAIDFVTILDADIKLFRNGEYPPYRGTHIQLDKQTHILYTRGSVEYYKTYTGKYPPQPIEIRIQESDESPNIICQEILSLTKMNWNNTQFDGKYPITIRCARNVGQIMKYLEPNQGEPQISYSFYM